jgi:predicted small secreted protein
MKTNWNVVIRRAAIAAAAAGMLTSCGTVKGFGNDVERAGNSIERTANRAER